MNPESSTFADGIAVIGMAGKFPGAPNLATFWHNVRNGIDSVTRFSPEEIEAAPALRDDPSYIKARAILPEVDFFDADFFGFQPREAEYTDPQHRLLLETAWEALENAACDSERATGPIGLFAGCSLNSYLLYNLASRPEFLAEFLASQQMGAHPALLGNDKDFLATRISYKLNLQGPSVSVQSACSTSLVAICQACQSLLAYQCDLALAGGVSVTFPQKRGYLYEEGSIVSRDGRCRPFDAAADGTVFGDGVGLVVLKRADEAIRDGDPIRAIIRGFAVNNDGSGKVSYMAPSVEGQSRAIASAHALAGIDVESIRYVETHGTGTFLGDPIEVAALTRAFAAATPARKLCALGALKGNIGHLEVAAGVAGLIKTVLALEHGEIPPVLHFAKPNPQIDFNATPFYVSEKLHPWPDSGQPRRAGVSSFGVGGTNAHVVLEQAPEKPATEKSDDLQLLVLSAKTPLALTSMSRKLSDHLRQNPNLNMASVAATLQLGRRAFPCRRSLVARDGVMAATLLDESGSSGTIVPGTRPRIALLFPGQGAQQPGMGRSVYEHEPVFRRAADHCCDILKTEMKFDFREALFDVETDSAKAQLRQTEITQPALFIIEYALAQTWLARGVNPHFMLGHSLGEYVAAVLAGIFTLADALHLLAVRGRLMQNLPKGGMLAVALAADDLTSLLTPSLSLAAANSPRSSVVSGPHNELKAFGKTLEERGVASRALETSHAFHSSALDGIVDEFRSAVDSVARSSPRVPIFSTRLGRLGTDAEWTDPAYWSRQMREPVLFSPALQALLKQDNLILLEVGPGQTLCSFARQHAGKKPRLIAASCTREAGPDDREALLATTGKVWEQGAEIDWSALHQEKCRRLALPTYPFERKRYWIEPLKKEESVRPDELLSALPRSTREKNDAVPLGSSKVELLVNEQLRIMAKQIEVLRRAKEPVLARGEGEA